MTVSVQGAELFYFTRGSGHPCLVLSAIGTKPYELQMPRELSDRLKLVFVDLRGGGRSTGDPADLTFDVLAQDLEAIRADLGVERIAVLGHSILGVLAIEYGRRRPASVSHVVTVGTPPRGDMAWGAAQSRAFFEEDAAPLFAGAEVKPGLLGHLLGPLTAAWDVTVGASALRVPIFLAHGRYDYIVPHVLWDGIPAQLPDATFHLFERSGHQPFFEEPARFAQTVTDWMASRS